MTWAHLSINKRVVLVNIQKEVLFSLIHHKSIVWLIKEWCTPSGNHPSILM
jgi:hypothetical protein